MKGIVLAGGTGSRLRPLTEVCNKHLLAVGPKPMIFHPIETLRKMGIKEILIVTGGESVGDMMKLLGSGKRFGMEFTYKVQDEAGGIAQALGLAEYFANGDMVTVILGDNIFTDTFDIADFKEGARIFLKEVDDPQRFGVAEVKDDKVISIEEKPKAPKSNLAVTGLYVYDHQVFDIIKTLKPSGRGELEITDVNNAYIQQDKMQASFVQGGWTDAGTFESLLKANVLAGSKKD